MSHLGLYQLSTRLRTSVKFFVDWLSNGSPPWAAYRAFMTVLLIALDKHPGVHLFGGGETWKRFFMIVLKVTGPEATMACQNDPLCAGIKVVIDGPINGVQVLCDKNCLQRNGVFCS